MSEHNTKDATPDAPESTTESIQEDPVETDVVEEVDVKGKKKKPSKAQKELLAVQEKVADLEVSLAAVEKIREEEKDAILRARAETENFKRRKEQEKSDYLKFATESMIRELLVVLDSFDIAVQHAEKKDQKMEELISGFVLIRKQMHTFLDKMNVKKIEALDHPFDPNLHQAISQEEVDNKDAQIVIREMQPGYTLHDRVVRPAMVVVSK